MRFYNQVHRFYRGVDLHARTLAVCILDQADTLVFADNLAAVDKKECERSFAVGCPTA